MNYMKTIAKNAKELRELSAIVQTSENQALFMEYLKSDFNLRACLESLTNEASIGRVEAYTNPRLFCGQHVNDEFHQNPYQPTFRLSNAQMVEISLQFAREYLVPLGFRVELRGVDVMVHW